MKYSMIKILHKDGYENQATEAVGIPVDVSEFKQVILTCRIADIQGTNPTVDIKVQHSMDGIHWTDLVKDWLQGLFPRMTAPGSYSIELTKFGRFIRLFWTLSVSLRINPA